MAKQTMTPERTVQDDTGEDGAAGMIQFHRDGPSCPDSESAGG